MAVIYLCASLRAPVVTQALLCWALHQNLAQKGLLAATGLVAPQE